MQSQNGITSLTEFPQSLPTSNQVPLTSGLDSQISTVANSTFFQVDSQEHPQKKQKTEDTRYPLKNIPFIKEKFKIFGNASELTDCVDTRLIVGETEFRLHAQFLSLFPNLYQQAMNNISANKQDQPIIIEDCSERIFKKMLTFSYAGQVECEWYDICELSVQAAEREGFQEGSEDFPPLTKFCFEELDEILEEKGLLKVEDRLLPPETEDEDDLETPSLVVIELINSLDCDLEDPFYEKIHNFILANAKTIFENKFEMQEIGQDSFFALLSSDQLALPELEILKYALDWIESQDSVEALKKCIRWDLLKDEELDQVKELTTKKFSVNGSQEIQFFNLETYHLMLKERSTLKNQPRKAATASHE